MSSLDFWFFSSGKENNLNNISFDKSPKLVDYFNEQSLLKTDKPFAHINKPSAKIYGAESQADIRAVKKDISTAQKNDQYERMYKTSVKKEDQYEKKESLIV